MLFYGQSRLNLIVDCYDSAVMLLWNTKKVHLNRQYNVTAAAQGVSRIGTPSWNNLKRTLQLIHSGHNLFVVVGPRGAPNYSEQEEFIQGMTNVAGSMDHEEWDFAEDAFQMLRQGWVALNPKWAK